MHLTSNLSSSEKKGLSHRPARQPQLTAGDASMIILRLLTPTNRTGPAAANQPNQTSMARFMPVRFGGQHPQMNTSVKREGACLEYSNNGIFNE